MERNQVTELPILELNEVNYIVVVHAVSVNIDTAKVRFYSLTLANSHITMGADYPLT